MLEYLGEAEAARGIEASVVAVLSEGAPLTADLGGHGTTSDVSLAVAEREPTWLRGPLDLNEWGSASSNEWRSASCDPG